jgi:hypothetical protein
MTIPGNRSIADQLNEALGEGSMFDELSELEEQFLWEEEDEEEDDAHVAGTPDPEDPTTDQALEPEELEIQRARIQKAARKVEPGVNVAMSDDSPGDFLVTVTKASSSIAMLRRMSKVERAIRNLGFKVTQSKEGLRLFVYAEEPSPPPMKDGEAGGAPPPPPKKKPKPSQGNDDDEEPENA